MSDKANWQATWHDAQHWNPITKDRLICTLCPRNCRINYNKVGFCGVRKNIEGELKTLNYGKSVPVTCESIETEAVFHYAPGESILSLGNIGCMMKCDFCQNWTTSQSRLVSDKNIELITPESVVNYALEHNIRMLSWTYNDPVVWQEFVVDTAKLAQSKGIKNLYKSAFYINPAAIDELIEVMDIFSISIKSMNSDFYRRVTKGRLEPVLEGVLQVYEAIQKGRNIHLELSNLCVTGRNDTLDDTLKVAHWMLEHLNDEVPLHYVRFHPDYLYTNVERTSITFLEKARLAAMNLGLKYVYVGNVAGTPSANTYCPTCQATQVERYGLVAKNYMINGKCFNCSTQIAIQMPWRHESKEQSNNTCEVPPHYRSMLHTFRGVIRSCHVEKRDEQPIYYQFKTKDGNVVGELQKATYHRLMLSSPTEDVVAVHFFYEKQAPQVFEVYDRAHFPVLEAYQTMSHSENIPPVLNNQLKR